MSQDNSSTFPAISEIGSYLLVQLKRFVSYNNQFIKGMKYVQCTPNNSVPVNLVDKSLIKKILTK